ncbi:MAG: STAS domain-containing protein [Thioploca sp.]|nr:STAS domain-containing protein [Thioploca sp.]
MSQLSVADEHTWRLSGELSFTTVSSLLSELLQRAAQSPPQIVDFSEVTRADSAGLALLIEMRKQPPIAAAIFRHIPKQMLILAEVCGVESLLTEAVTVAP